MELIVDNRDSDCRYIDKVRLQVANDNELFKLHIIDNESKLYVACNLIAAAKGLNENERDLYYLINLIAKDSCTIPCRGMKDSYHANFDKSESTLNRTIDRTIIIDIKNSYVNSDTGEITYGIVNQNTIIDSVSYLFSWKILK